MSKKNETKVLCPECGAELAIADKTITTVATVIGKDAGIGVVYAEVVGKEVKPAKKLPKTAKERIEALRDAGVDVSHLFAMQGANGGECVASNKDGKLVVLDDNDPLFELIIKQGTVPNPRLFRRWVMAQMFYMMTALDYRTKQPMGVTAMIHRMGYEYQWKMLLDELYAQMKMEHRDPENFTDRNRWFNAEVATKMASEYIGLLKKRVDMIKVRKCKGVPYKRIAGKNIFVSDLYSKLYRPLESAMYAIRRAKNAAKLYEAVTEFNSLRLKMHWQTPQCSAWIDAYKGSGAFFTMQNLIRFHGCVAYDDAGKRLDKYQSLAFITTKAKMYRNGDGWRLLAVLKKMLEDNGIDLKRKMAEWRKK